MNTPKVVIVIPVHNALPFVQNTLAALQDPAITSQIYPTVVVDDASNPETRKFLQDWRSVESNWEYTNRLVLFNTCQQLFTRTSNRGIRAAVKVYNPQYVVLMNSDCRLQPGWDTAMLRILEQDATVGEVGYRDGTPPGLEDLYEDVQEPGYVTAHLVMFRTQALREVGVLCETDTDGRNFPESRPYQGCAHIFSDRLMSYQMNRGGYKTVYCNHPGVEHEGGQSWKHDLGWLSTFPLQPMWEARDIL